MSILWGWLRTEALRSPVSMALFALLVWQHHSHSQQIDRIRADHHRQFVELVRAIQMDRIMDMSPEEWLLSEDDHERNE